MENKLLTLLPKMYFPKKIFWGNKAGMFFKTIENEKKLIFLSDNFYKGNEEKINVLFGNSDVIMQSGEPTDQSVNKLKEKCQQDHYDYIVAFGGGSILDTAKIVKEELNIKLVAVPTTIGSGAEVSQHALLKGDNTKLIKSSVGLISDVVIIDPTYLATLSKEQIIYQSIDALSHSLESLVSKMSNPMSDMLALVAIDQIYFNLEKLSKGDEINTVASNIQAAAIYAGLAQSSAATGLAHAVAHVIGSKFNINHAKAVSYYLLDVLELNSSKSDKYEKFDQLKHLSKASLLPKLTELFKAMNIDMSGKPEIDQPAEIAVLIKKDICNMTNPVPTSEEEINALLTK